MGFWLNDQTLLLQFNAVERVGTVVDVLTTTRHNAFPVLEENGAVLCGLVLRYHIMVLLEKRAFLDHSDDSYIEKKPALTSSDFAKPGSGKGMRIEYLHVTPEEREKYLDLRFVANTSPYTVVETMSLAKAFTLFRQLGLRHLCVIPKKSRTEVCSLPPRPTSWLHASFVPKEQH